MEENNFVQEKIEENFNNEAHIGKIPPITKTQSKKIISQINKQICKIYASKEKYGTGFFCKIYYPNEFILLATLITNNHVLNEKDLEINNTIKITLEDDKIEKNILINKFRLTYTNPDLDVTIIQIKPEDQIEAFLDIDENVFNKDYTKIYKKDTCIYLLQYPEGVFASYAVGSINKILKPKIFHTCSTELGSSGSPILLLSNFKVIGVHRASHQGQLEVINLGTLIRFPIEELNRKYPNISFNIKNLNPKNSQEISEKMNNNQETKNISNKDFKSNHQNFQINNSDYINVDKKLLIVICSSCFIKNICCICRNSSENMSKLGFNLFAHSKCWEKNKCLNCGQMIETFPLLRICQKCKNTYIIKDTECYICRGYF